MKLFIVRHGQTIWNKEHRLQGKYNSDLTEIGREQAIILGEHLRKNNIQIDHFISSPLGRAFETAKLIANTDEIIIRDNLAEMAFGKWEGKDLDEIKEEAPEEFYNFFNEAHKYDPSINEGENFTSLEARVRDELKHLTSTYQNENILIVSHGITIKMIFSIIKNQSLEQFWKSDIFQNTSLSLVNFNKDKFSVEYISDTSFLPKDLTTSFNKVVEK